MPYPPHFRNRTCKMCERVLEGLVGVAERSENYFSIKGTLTLQKKDPESGKRYWVHITNDPEEIMNFCNFRCLEEYFTFKEKMRSEERLAAKRAMNREQWASGNGGFNTDEQWYGKGK